MQNVRRINRIIKVGIFLLTFGLIVSGFPILAEDSYETPKENELTSLKAKAHKIISSQIDAFRKSDIDEAYNFASPFIKSRFANAEIFGQMVKNGYPMIWSAKDYKFLEFTFFNGALVQRVLFMDSKERIFVFDYELRQYESETWLINGVFKVSSASSGA